MGLVGRKCGMTRVFTDDGVSIPVTVIEAQPNRITQVKTVETDGYRALQVAAGSRKASRVSKSVSLTAIRRTSRSARNYVLICLPKARR
jgi:large subunit ribosomal protein L3